MEEKKKVKMKVTNSFGIYDIYKKIRKNGWYDIGRPLKEHEFYSIVRQVNLRFADELSKGNTVMLPEHMGSLELRKTERGVSIVDGKVKNTYPINWADTLKLWCQDEEAKKSKILLRDKEPYIFRVKYVKNHANYNNKTFYQFTLNRFIKIRLKDNIKAGKIDTLWIG